MRTALRARLPFLVDSGYATLTAGSAALLLVLLTIAGRFLSADDYGRFSYALALTTIVETIMDLGLSQVTVRSVALATYSTAPRPATQAIPLTRAARKKMNVPFFTALAERSPRSAPPPRPRRTSGPAPASPARH